MNGGLEYWKKYFVTHHSNTYFRTSWRSIHKNLFANGLSRSRHFLKILTCSLFTFNLSFAKSLKPEKSFGEFECIFRNKCCSRLSQTLHSRCQIYSVSNSFKFHPKVIAQSANNQRTGMKPLISPSVPRAHFKYIECA